MVNSLLGPGGGILPLQPSATLGQVAATPGPGSGGGQDVFRTPTGTMPSEYYMHYIPHAMRLDKDAMQSGQGMSNLSIENESDRLMRMKNIAEEQQKWIEQYTKKQIAAGQAGPAQAPGAGILPVQQTTAVPQAPAPVTAPNPAPATTTQTPAAATPASDAVTPTPTATSPASSPYQQFYINSLLSTMPKELGGQVGADGGYYIPNPDVPGGWVRVDPNNGGSL